MEEFPGWYFEECGEQFKSHKEIAFLRMAQTFHANPDFVLNEPLPQWFTKHLLDVATKEAARIGVGGASPWAKYTREQWEQVVYIEFLKHKRELGSKAKAIEAVNDWIVRKVQEGHEIPNFRVTKKRKSANNSEGFIPTIKNIISNHS